MTVHVDENVIVVSYRYTWNSTDGSSGNWLDAVRLLERHHLDRPMRPVKDGAVECTPLSFGVQPANQIVRVVE